MKKMLLPMLTLSLLASCQKKYTCECYTETDRLASTHSIKVKKKDAIKKCSPSEFGYSNKWEGDCRLK